MQSTIGRTFAALNATNEAILYAKLPEELYGKVCETAFSSGGFLAVAVFLLEPDTGLLKFAAGHGDDAARLRDVSISIIANTPEGEGSAGERSATAKPASATITSTIPVRRPGAAVRPRPASARPRRCRWSATGAASASS